MIPDKPSHAQSRIGYGAMRLTGPGNFGPPADRAAAVALVRQAAEFGVVHFDTADAYGPGDSESILAEALAPFGDAVTQFVSKDDKYAMETFVAQSLEGQVKHMLSLNPDADYGADGEDLESVMERCRDHLEQQFIGEAAAAATSRGPRQRRRKVVRDRPAGWDSDLEGHWEDQPGNVTYETVQVPAAASSRRGRVPGGLG
ncbi:MAG: aldo/keto reductase, partial [Myxococcota bacterium]